jgi:mannose-6-phosphate isomerase class I
MAKAIRTNRRTRKVKTVKDSYKKWTKKSCEDIADWADKLNTIAIEDEDTMFVRSQTNHVRPVPGCKVYDPNEF